MTFELKDSDWTNTFEVSSHTIDADISGSGHVVVGDSDDNDTGRATRDVSWSVESDEDEVLSSYVDHRPVVKLDSINLLFYLNLTFLMLNTVFLGE